MQSRQAPARDPVDSGELTGDQHLAVVRLHGQGVYQAIDAPPGVEGKIHRPIGFQARHPRPAARLPRVRSHRQ
ncbi:MAG: hypothetical protein M5U12_21785 [Verrucomicrobia bacterium]|nr:hypothetical protein [Verrucomicrobiota bacterium]